MAANRSIRVKVLSEEKPSSAQIRALTEFKMQAVEHFPELRGQIYAELNKLRQGTLSDKSVGGFYSPSEKKIFIAKGLSPSGTREVVAHELAHAMSDTPRRGFRSTTEAFNKAYREYRQTNPGATYKSFAGTISNYAKTAKSEAFSEAFVDYAIKGKKAAKASQLIMKHWRK